MAGLNAEGGTVLISGTCSASSPAILADFRPNNSGGAGPDGYPANIYTVINRDTSNLYDVVVQVKGINDTATSSGFPVPSGVSMPFQLNKVSGEVVYVKAWVTTIAGTVDTTAHVYVTSGIMSRAH